MKLDDKVHITLVIALLLAGCVAAKPVKAARPNIIYLMLDEWGYFESGHMGHQELITPNIDQFAKEGMRFTNAYAACPICAPSRAAIMTGKFPSNTGFVDNYVSRLDGKTLLRSKDRQFLKLEEVTLAESLRRHGYKTGHFGKWHLGEHPAGPLQQGFDVQVPTNWYKGWPKAGYHAPFKLDGLADEQGDYLTDRLTDEAVRFIDESRETPFFLYLSHFAVHDPIQGRDDLVTKYERRNAQRVLTHIAAQF